MSDNYIEETKPLFKQLKTEAFRFVVVRYNHYSFVQQLERDLQSRFPERPCSILRANETTYKEVTETFFEQKKGFLIIEGFDDLLQDDKFDAKNDARRKDITIGLNLRRDKLAKFPIALFVCVPATAGKLYAKTMMEKMPDLWSFRSLMLDFEKEMNVKKESKIKSSSDFVFPTDLENYSPIFLNAEHIAVKKQELQRLKNILANTTKDEIAYRLTLYPQIVAIQVEIGSYQASLNTLEDWEEIVAENDKGNIWFDKGDVLTLIGQLEKAHYYFDKAREYFDKNNDKNNLVLSYEKIGFILRKLGNLREALLIFQKQNDLAKSLYEDFPLNSHYKNNLAISFSKLGDVQSDLENFKDALALYQEYNNIEVELYHDFPNNVNYKNGLAISYSKLGDIHYNLENSKIALLFYLEDINLAKELCRDFPNNVNYKNELSISYGRLGDIQCKLGNLQESLQFYKEYNKLAKVLLQNYPDSLSCKNNLSVSYSNLGSIYLDLDDFEKSKKNFEKSFYCFKELFVNNIQDISFKSNYAEALAIDNALNLLSNKPTNTASINKAFDIWQSLFKQTTKEYYTKKISILTKMTQNEGNLKALIKELSSF